jgi:hypothetical protein
MTTNVPQDVLEDAVAAGFYSNPHAHHGGIHVGGDVYITDRLMKFVQLRAQREQGAEPVAPYCYAVVAYGNVQQTAKREDVAFEMAEKASDNCIDGVVEVVTLYTTPPQANALVAAAYRKAAEICDKQAELDRAAHEAPAGSITCGSPYHEGAADAADECMFKILAAIPADAEAALREVCMKVAEAVDNKWQDAHRAPKSLEAIVNSVLGEGGK